MIDITYIPHLGCFQGMGIPAASLRHWSRHEHLVGRDSSPYPLRRLLVRDKGLKHLYA